MMVDDDDAPNQLTNLLQSGEDGEGWAHPGLGRCNKQLHPGLESTRFHYVNLKKKNEKNLLCFQP